MSYYQDPTASRALGNVNREYSKQVKKAKTLLKLYKQGKLSEDALEKARKQFKGIYKYVLYDVIAKDTE